MGGLTESRRVAIASSHPPYHIGYRVTFSEELTDTEGFGSADQVVGSRSATGGTTSGTDVVYGEGAVKVEDDGSSLRPLEVRVDGQVVEIPTGGSKTFPAPGDSTSSSSTSSTSTSASTSSSSSTNSSTSASASESTASVTSSGGQAAIGGGFLAYAAIAAGVYLLWRRS